LTFNPMKVAAFQAPLLADCPIQDVLCLIREQLHACESAGVELLCCPEAILGGLADHTPRPTQAAIDVARGQLDPVLSSLRSDTVTTILGCTEVDRGRLYNSAAICHRGLLAGIYRKRHPAINRSVYDAGEATSVFTVGTLTFGILICRDSTDPELAPTMAARGATALFVPSNNGLPYARANEDLVTETRNVDTSRAIDNGVAVVRADVAGRAGDLLSYGTSAIIDRRGQLVASAKEFFASQLLIGEI
jgi:predicted amidohydrolase